MAAYTAGHRSYPPQGATTPVCQMLASAKATFYYDKIAACGQDSKSLLRLMDNILGRGHGTHLPDMDSTTDMVNASGTIWAVQLSLCCASERQARSKRTKGLYCATRNDSRNRPYTCRQDTE